MKTISLILLTLAAFTLETNAQSADTTVPVSPQQKVLYYTCSMHPQVHEDHAGDCPTCGMTLEPIYKNQK